jgi:hypothetical protein
MIIDHRQLKEITPQAIRIHGGDSTAEIENVP